MEFILRLINPSIYINKESPIYIQEVFIGSKTINSDALKYPKGKNKLRLQSLLLAGGGIVPTYCHQLLDNFKPEKIVVNRHEMEDFSYVSMFLYSWSKEPNLTMGRQ